MHNNTGLTTIVSRVENNFPKYGHEKKQNIKYPTECDWQDVMYFF